MLFASVFAVTYTVSLVCACLLYILVWMAFPEIEKYRKTSIVIILGLSVVLNIHYARLDYNPGHHYNSLADYIHGKEISSEGRQ
ncbi:hypothetical protein DEEACLCL_00115 [Salmonella phage CRW-SP2]|nr:hypothetical protein DEEACLCL_00115 [Salmonella phage CRW-SP2]